MPPVAMPSKPLPPRKMLAPMKAHSPLFALAAALVVLAGCSSYTPSEMLKIGYGPTTVSMQKQGQEYFVSADITINIINTSERGMNVAFLEGTLYDQATEKALVRFRPIIPESYGSTSTAQLFPKQTRDFKVVTPLDLPGFDPAKTPNVLVKLAFQTTEGFRSEVVSAPIAVTVTPSK